MNPKCCFLLLCLLPLATLANDYIGVPIGAPIERAELLADPDARNRFTVEGPFEGLFSRFDAYRAQLHEESNHLVRAEAQKVYTSFGECSDDTVRIWNQLKQEFGRPTADDSQQWWFDIGEHQRISVNCKIYGGSGKIALNLIVVDNELAHVTGE